MSRDMELLLPLSGRGSFSASVLMCNKRATNNYRQINQNPHQGWGCTDMYLQTVFILKQADLQIHTEEHTKFIRHK